MDEELRRAVEQLSLRIEAVYQALGEMRSELMSLMNNQHERLINDITGLRGDFMAAREFLLHDSVGRGRQWLDLEERVSKLERGEKP